MDVSRKKDRLVQPLSQSRRLQAQYRSSGTRGSNESHQRPLKILEQYITSQSTWLLAYLLIML